MKKTLGSADDRLFIGVCVWGGGGFVVVFVFVYVCVCCWVFFGGLWFLVGGGGGLCVYLIKSDANINVYEILWSEVNTLF